MSHHAAKSELRHRGGGDAGTARSSPAGTLINDDGIETVCDATTHVVTGTSAARVTLDRPLPHDLDEAIPAPWLPRATRAVDADHPDGTLHNPHENMSVLQQHVMFFDRNNDGIITPLETYQGFRALGFNILFSIAAMLVINLNFAYVTQKSWIPDPRFYIHVENIHKAKHGSDSGTYDTEGRFIPAKFEELFAKYAKTNPGYLTFAEGLAMTEALRCATDPFGWFAAKFEFGTLYLLCMERDPTSGERIMPREYMRAQYDGSLFYRIEQTRKDEAHRRELAMAHRRAAIARGEPADHGAPIDVAAGIDMQGKPPAGLPPGWSMTNDTAVPTVG
ncbi:hypothetical protein H9P43_006093 [Blastocladiella emersonii ATCC 22665]|nr:hypothetical protein H9P43_006093 [Blastocladiella emersonii ATCC 22665]